MATRKTSPKSKALTQKQIQSQLRQLSGALKKHINALSTLKKRVDDLIPRVPPGDPKNIHN